jgi:hypothetical protein
MIKFAIKLKYGKKDKALANMIKELVTYFPQLKVEGLNHSLRPATVVGVNPLAVLPGLNVILAEKRVEERDLLCVGVSSKFDISFESDVPRNLLGFATIKTLDIKKDYKKIIILLSKYLVAKYPTTALKNIANNWKKPVRVIKHSTLVIVDGIPMSHAAYQRKYTTQKACSVLDALFNALK